MAALNQDRPLLLSMNALQALPSKPGKSNGRAQRQDTNRRGTAGEWQQRTPRAQLRPLLSKPVLQASAKHPRNHGCTQPGPTAFTVNERITGITVKAGQVQRPRPTPRHKQARNSRGVATAHAPGTTAAVTVKAGIAGKRQTPSQSWLHSARTDRFYCQ